MSGSYERYDKLQHSGAANHHELAVKWRYLSLSSLVCCSLFKVAKLVLFWVRSRFVVSFPRSMGSHRMIPDDRSDRIRSVLRYVSPKFWEKRSTRRQGAGTGQQLDKADYQPGYSSL